MVKILAEVGDSFFVTMSTIDTNITLIDKEGIPYVIEYPDKPITALILKEDYWNNVPNYLIIKDSVTA
jgi:hypothetical protein